MTLPEGYTVSTHSCLCRYHSEFR